MPIRFQVDPDFYDHPKSIDLSDAAVALWTRAGSYSAAKLLDGLVPTNALPSLSGTADDAAAELVRAGLWRKVRKGFQFHQWEHRNLTRSRVEHERKLDRERKQTAREIKATKSGSQRNAQVSDGDVRSDSGRTSEWNPDGDPAGVRSMSVSMSVSKALTSSKRETHVSNASDSEPTPTLQEESRSAPVDLSVMKIVRSYTSKVNPSNASNIAAHITNATATWDLDTIAKAVTKMAAEGRQLGADSLRIELNQVGPDKHGMQRFQDGSSVDWNTGRRTSKGGIVIGGGGYWSGKQQWSEG